MCLRVVGRDTVSYLGAWIAIFAWLKRCKFRNLQFIDPISPFHHPASVTPTSQILLQSQTIGVCESSGVTPIVLLCFLALEKVFLLRCRTGTRENKSKLPSYRPNFFLPSRSTSQTLLQSQTLGVCESSGVTPIVLFCFLALG